MVRNRSPTRKSMRSNVKLGVPANHDPSKDRWDCGMDYGVKDHTSKYSKSNSTKSLYWLVINRTRYNLPQGSVIIPWNTIITTAD